MRVLLIVHGFPPMAMGGTEIYVHGLARALRDQLGDAVFVLAREADPSRAEFAMRREDRAGIGLALINNTFRQARSFEETYRNATIQRLGAHWLDEVRPEIVHIHHLTGLSTDLIAECARRRIPTVFTLNDYWLICHRGQLLDVAYRRCSGPAPDSCERCVDVAGQAGPAVHRLAPFVRALDSRLPSSPARLLRRVVRATARYGGTPGTGWHEMEKRVRHIRRMCGLVTQFLAPSRTIRDRHVAFGIDAARIRAQEQGIDVARFRGVGHIPGDRLRIGFLGSLIASKAPHLVLEALRGLPPGAAEVHLFGAYAPYHGDDRYRHVLEPLLGLPGVRHHGPVPHSEVPGALASIDVLVVPSVWLENAPFVIREAFAAGVPVITARLGGMAEMVRHEQDGLLFEPGDVDALRRTLERLMNEAGLLERLRRGITPVRTIEQDARWTRDLYRAYLAPNGKGNAQTLPPSAMRARTGNRLAAVVLNYRAPGETALAVRSLQASRRPIDRLIVVENGSGDGSANFLRDALAEITLVETGRNLGFSGGCNVGIRAALDDRADLVLLANSDVIVPPDAVSALEEALAPPDVGIAGPLIVSRPHPDHVLSAGMSFSGMTGRMRHHAFKEPAATLELPPYSTVDGVSGCVMLIKREVFARIGFLAEEFFFSFEDLDFCLRARTAGYRTVCVNRVRGYHEGSASIGSQSPRRIYFATRNHLLLAYRHPLRVGLVSSARAVMIMALNLAHCFTSESPTIPALIAATQGAWHHMRGRYGSDT